MKTKGEVFKRFQEFKALMENKTRKKIKMLRSDNGGEYTFNKFKEFCAERKNKAIVWVARVMLHDQGLSFFLWAKACNTAVCLQKRHPHRVLGSKTPTKAFSGKKPKIGHFMIFWSLTFHMSMRRRGQS